MRNRILCVILACLSLLGLLSGCSADGAPTFDSLDDFENATLGVVTGSIYDGYSRELFPDARIDYYQIFPDLFGCVQQGKVDGFMLDLPNFNAVKRTSPALSYLDIPQYDVEIGYAFAKTTDGSVLQSQMNELLNQLKADGTVDRLIEKWYGTTEPTDELPIPDFSDNPTKLRVAVDAGRKPFVYMRNGEYVGFEIEVMYMFCEAYGYNPQIENVQFASGLAGLATGKFDFVGGGLYMTPARKETVNFSDPYMYADVVMVTYGGEASGSFLATMAEKFNRTFIEENRWQLIVEGIGITLLITLASALLGTLLGFAVYMLCRRFGKPARAIVKVCNVLLGGTPIVVVLMILYYVVLGSLDVSGIVVAILGFTLTTGSFVYEKLTVAVDGIEGGQTEAALAMGFTPTGAFMGIVLPQAMKFFLPIYAGELVSLLKATAIVGYISVQDLTRMSDIIRSNTFEAFFPLIASALIYLLLTLAITAVMSAVRRLLEPKNRKPETILKGVKTK